jgi:hypothetical protein
MARRLGSLGLGLGSDINLLGRFRCDNGRLQERRRNTDGIFWAIQGPKPSENLLEAFVNKLVDSIIGGELYMTGFSTEKGAKFKVSEENVSLALPVDRDWIS